MVPSSLHLPLDEKAESASMASCKDRLLHDFKGHSVIIPDLYALFPGWRFDVNEKYPSLKEMTDSWTDSWIDDEHMRLAMKKADLALLAAAFYPDAEEFECLVGAYFHVWVFVYDDEIDCGLLTSNDLAKMQVWKLASDAALAYSLGERPFLGPSPPMNTVMRAFCDDFAQPVAAGSTKDVRLLIHKEVQDFCDSATALPLQRHSEHNRLLDVETYIKQRQMSGGCGTTVSILLYVYHLDIPTHIMDHEAMKTIWDHTCRIVHFVNDIVSFVKELRADQIDNIVPVLALNHKIPLQEAIHRACDMVVESRKALEDAETRLPMPTGDVDLDKQIERYVQGCKDVAAGNLHWSYLTVRYFGESPIRDGNAITLVI